MSTSFQQGNFHSLSKSLSALTNDNTFGLTLCTFPFAFDDFVPFSGLRVTIHLQRYDNGIILQEGMDVAIIMYNVNV